MTDFTIILRSLSARLFSTVTTTVTVAVATTMTTTIATTTTTATTTARKNTRNTATKGLQQYSQSPATVPGFVLSNPPVAHVLEPGNLTSWAA